METLSFIFNHDGVGCHGTGDFFGESDMPILNKAYFSWKDMNEVNMAYGTRRANLPELVSEGLASALFGWARTNNTIITGVSSSSCDLIDPETGDLIQLKACSTVEGRKPGPTSFGPTTEFDVLIFMHVNCDTDQADFYLLNAQTYKQLKVNRNETIADQQAQGRRPRLTLLNKIEEEGLEPFYTYIFKR